MGLGLLSASMAARLRLHSSHRISSRHISPSLIPISPLSSLFFSFSCSFHLISALRAGAHCCFFFFCSDASNAPPLFLPSSNFLPVFLMLHSPGCAIFYSLSPLPACCFPHFALISLPSLSGLQSPLLIWRCCSAHTGPISLRQSACAGSIISSR